MATEEAIAARGKPAWIPFLVVLLSKSPAKCDELRTEVFLTIPRKPEAGVPDGPTGEALDIHAVEDELPV